MISLRKHWLSISSRETDSPSVSLSKASAHTAQNQLIICSVNRKEVALNSAPYPVWVLGGFHVLKFKPAPSFFIFPPSRLASFLRSVTRSYYRNSVGSLLVFDMTNRASFDHIMEWHAEVCEHVQPHKVLFVLVGQKWDREAQGERVVSREEAESLAGQLGMPYVEVSAKTGMNVRNAFELLTRRVYQGLLSGEVELQEGWDGVKCAAPQALQLQRASLVQPRAAPKNNKCCG